MMVILSASMFQSRDLKSWCEVDLHVQSTVSQAEGTNAAQLKHQALLCHQHEYRHRHRDRHRQGTSPAKQDRRKQVRRTDWRCPANRERARSRGALTR